MSNEEKRVAHASLQNAKNNKKRNKDNQISSSNLLSNSTYNMNNFVTTKTSLANLDVYSDFTLQKYRGDNQTATSTNKDSNQANVNADDGYALTKVREERIWVESIDRECKSIKEWEEKWSFLADYDQKGELKMKEKLPDRVNMFSDKLPSSCGHVYGHRLLTEEAKQMVVMEQNLSMNYRRRRDNVLIAYD